MVHFVSLEGAGPLLDDKTQKIRLKMATAMGLQRAPQSYPLPGGAALAVHGVVLPVQQPQVMPYL